jgi:ribosome-associated protein
MDVGRRSAMCEAFVVMTAASTVRVKSVVERIEEALEEEGQRVLHKEGLSEATWVLMDYGDVVAHVFHPDMRHFYSLEKLWGDAPTRPYLDGAPSRE